MVSSTRDGALENSRGYAREHSASVRELQKQEANVGNQVKPAVFFTVGQSRDTRLMVDSGCDVLHVT